ncbi:MAG: VWA domain-containing protein, partial [Planctomycetales bacterium]|nr:VWA domain-containing protein [Planctomycetales bacterium]
MRKEKRMELARQAAGHCIDLDILTAEDQVGVLAFSDDSQWVTPIVPCRERDQLKQKIERLEAGGTTEMYPALWRAYLALGEV